MEILNKIKSIFRIRKPIDLRAACIAEYGEEFGEKYDRINKGQAIGDILETISFLNQVEKVKDKYKFK